MGTNASGQKVDVTMIGTLPPVKGISPYCSELVSLLGKHLRVEFIDFKRLYPEKLYPGRTEEEDLYPIDLDSINMLRRRMLDFCNPLTWIKAGISIQGHIVHAQWWSGVLAPVYLVVLGLARLRGKRVIITVHNVDPHEGGALLRLLNGCILPLGDEFVVHGEACREKLLGKVGAKKKIHVVPHPPFNCVRNAPASGVDAEAVRGELGMESEGPLLIFFGNIRDYKGLDVLFRALPRVSENHPGLRLLVAGQPWVDWEKYERIIEEEGIGKYVVTRLEHLPFSDLERYIAASDLAVFPFKHLDSASGTVTLARALGKPVVVSEVGDMRALRGPEVLLARPRCPESLAAAIDEALRRNSRMGDTPCPEGTVPPEAEGSETARGHMLIYRGSAPPVTYHAGGGQGA